MKFNTGPIFRQTNPKNQRISIILMISQAQLIDHGFLIFYAKSRGNWPKVAEL